MPRVKRRNTVRVRVRDYAEPQFRLQLETGHDFFGDAFGHPPDLDEMREAWGAMKADILRRWYVEHPGTRPYAWWLFDAPERRRRIDGGVHPFDDPMRDSRVEAVGASPNAAPEYRENAYRLYFGCPASLIVPDDFKAMYESQADYLDRLGLLEPGERAVLATV